MKNSSVTADGIYCAPLRCEIRLQNPDAWTRFVTYMSLARTAGELPQLTITRLHLDGFIVRPDGSVAWWFPE